MNRYPQQIPPKWWPPKLSRFWVRVWKSLRKRDRIRKQKLMEVEVRGLENLRRELAAGHGVMITPNHPGHADANAMYYAADKLGTPFYFLTAWQVFFEQGWIGQRILQHHGCFSIDREGTDLRAFRMSTEILQERAEPLVVFPEGEVYHVNDCVTPFREGAAAIALSAAKRAKRELVCVPCGIKYHYLSDPTNQLVDLMNRLEAEIFWRPRPDLPLQERIYRFAEGAMALKELEHAGRTSAGPLPERTKSLACNVLQELEKKHGLETHERAIPERVKSLRRAVLKEIDATTETDNKRKEFENDLDDIFLVVQLYSYPGNYVAERPTIERMAETLDKFEEDVLGAYSATIRGPRKATVAFGDSIPVPHERGKGAAEDLTTTLESAVQKLVDQIDESAARP